MAEHAYPDSGINKNSRKYFDQRRAALTLERSSFIKHYMDLSKFIQPRRGRFFTQDRNKGEARHQSIINSKATWAHRTARAGMFAGVMSPTRPWFRLETHDPALMEFHPVKVWLAEVERIMRAIFNQGNLYNMAPTMLGELLLFGTGCMMHVDDFEDVARFYTHTAGSYMIAQNERGVVNNLVREFQMTVGQMVADFGLQNVSNAVSDQYSKGNYDLWYDVVHFIEPNPMYDPNKMLAKFKRFRSYKYEPGQADVNEKFLSQSGFERFPAYVPRWGVTGEDVYGTDCPAMDALGDIKQLQIEEKRKAQGIAKMVNPPLVGPASVRNVPVSSLPGGLSIYDTGQGGTKLEPLYTVNPQLQDMLLDIAKVEKRIEDDFYVTMFMAISNMEGVQPKNQLELTQRNEERLLQLGPVLERVHGEFLDRLIDRVFDQMIEANMVPPAPPEIQGQSLKVVFISSLAIAQRAVATADIDRLSAFVAGLTEMGYEVVKDKYDADQAVDEYGHLLGTPPKLVVPDERVAEIRAERQQQEQQAEQRAMMMEFAKSGGGAIKDIGSIDLGGDNVMARAANIIQEQVGG